MQDGARHDDRSGVRDMVMKFLLGVKRLAKDFSEAVHLIIGVLAVPGRRPCFRAPIERFYPVSNISSSSPIRF